MDLSPVPSSNSVVHAPERVSSRSRRTRRPSYKVLANADMGYDGAMTFKRRRTNLDDEIHSVPLSRRGRKMGRVEVVVPRLRQLDIRLSMESRVGSSGLEASSRQGGERQQEDEVESPPLQIKEEEDAKMYFLLQARIKVEVKTEEIMSEDVVRGRLALIGYETLEINVPKDILDVTTTRDFTSRVWGGSMRMTFPKIGKEFTHGLDDFMYTSLLFDPHAPRWPGAPGLVFKFIGDGQEWPKIMRVIVRLRSQAWQYMGQYQLTAAPPLTPEEWNAQSKEVKRRWARKLSDRKQSDGGLKARIVLRKRLKRDPTAEEVEAALRSGEQFHASAKDILKACDEGRAVVRVWCMKCVGYDESFQRRIATGY